MFYIRIFQVWTDIVYPWLIIIFSSVCIKDLLISDLWSWEIASILEKRFSQIMSISIFFILFWDMSLSLWKAKPWGSVSSCGSFYNFEIMAMWSATFINIPIAIRLELIFSLFGDWANLWMQLNIWIRFSWQICWM